MRRPAWAAAAAARGAAPLLLALLTAAPVLADAFGAAAVGTSVSAVEKVIQLLTDMSARAKEGKNAEAVEYAKFEQFCTDTTTSKSKEVDEATVLIGALSGDISKLDEETRGLSDKIGALQATIASSNSNLEEARQQREREKAGHAQALQDALESADALERAIAVLQRQGYDRGQASAALLQLSRGRALPQSARRAVSALLEMEGGGDFLTREAPEANAYEFQSGGLVELLKRLLVDFIGKRSEAQKQELNSQHAHELLSQDLHDVVENAKADIADSTALLQEKKAMLADGQKRLAAATADRDEDAAYLSNLKAECSEKGKSFQEKQGLRAEEIRAIEKAIEILRSPDVLGSAQAHLPAAAAASLGQLGTSLAQLRRAACAGIGAGGGPEAPGAGAAGARGLLAGFLRSEGRRLRSSRLGLLADKVATSSDPFAKVKKLIEDMITKLLREAGEESEHKGWCDTELGTNGQTRTKLQSDVDALTARVDEAEATAIEIAERLSALAQEVNELSGAMQESTDMRQAEKVKNTATIADAVEAQKAIAAAVAVLKDFYAKASTATALLQAKAPQQPIQYDRVGNERVRMGSEEWDALANPGFEGQVDRGHKAAMQTFGETYTGQQSEAGGVLAMLEVIASDFENLEAGTAAAEAEATHTYQDFMADSKKSLAVKDKENEMLSIDKMETEVRLRSGKKDLAETQDQLLAAERYFEKLKPTCLDQGMTYEQRVAARQEEIQSLQEALRILRSEDLAAA